MKIRQTLVSLGFASAVAAAPAFAQTAVVVDPSLPPNTAVIITDQSNAYVVTPDTPAGTHLMSDQFGRTIIVDDAYGTPGAPAQRRSVFDSSVDRTTGTVTSPGYMGPRDASR